MFIQTVSITERNIRTISKAFVNIIWLKSKTMSERLLSNSLWRPRHSDRLYKQKDSQSSNVIPSWIVHDRVGRLGGGVMQGEGGVHQGPDPSWPRPTATTQPGSSQFTLGQRLVIKYLKIKILTYQGQHRDTARANTCVVPPFTSPQSRLANEEPSVWCGARVPITEAAHWLAARRSITPSRCIHKLLALVLTITASLSSNSHLWE